MTDVEIRAGRDEDWAVVGGLRWDSLQEFGGEALEDRATFAERFADWARGTGGAHECFVATAEAGVIGMMWLAVVRRVPAARAFDRFSGDLQCAYVVPEHRSSGVGALLVRAVLDRAAERGLERVTVHSSPLAVRFYERNGFAVDGKLMHVVLQRPVSTR
ncbi:GNAT family N-acetyltransferase [Leifsonia sp. NPDC080035]|uniref:GNAT family N-acetyltransferase n=1 Tax=Leifsonia sp. NPDC080035 TaxID=3143936 RepID=A0AAU7G927_9MICO